MAKNGVFHPNFMANNVQANWNAIQIVYGVNDPNEPMADKEHICYFHQIQSMDRNTKQQIKPKLHEQHKTLYYEYKNATFLEEIDDQYATIQCWWYSIEVVAEVGLAMLENWFSFWHFLVRQWGGFMKHTNL